MLLVRDFFPSLKPSLGTRVVRTELDIPSHHKLPNVHQMKYLETTCKCLHAQTIFKRLSIKNFWDIWGIILDCLNCLLVGRNGRNGFKNHWEQVSADNTGVLFLHYLCDWPATSTHVAVPALRICLLFRVERIDQYLIISSIFLTEK